MSARAAALAGLALLLTGVALATPVGVLRISPGDLDVPVADGGRYTYGYRQSIYVVPVVEVHERDGDRLRIVEARSSDPRAVEYFRWDGAMRREGDVYVQHAPPNALPALVIRVTTDGHQELRGEGWAVDLRAHFGETVVTVRPITLPRIVTLLERTR